MVMLTDHHILSYTNAKLRCVEGELAKPTTNSEPVIIDQMLDGIVVPHFLPPR